MSDDCTSESALGRLKEWLCPSCGYLMQAYDEPPRLKCGCGFTKLGVPGNVEEGEPRRDNKD